MSTRNTVIAGGLIILGGVLYSALLYPSLPAQIPTHWDLNGQVNGWTGRAWGAFFGPGFNVLLLALLMVLPALSPRQFQVDSFRRTYNYIALLVVGMIQYFEVISLQAALHPGLESGRWVVAGLMLMMAGMGNMLGKVRRNFWMGIRTPWTLANDTVWDGTHRLAARLLVAAGGLGALAAGLGAPLALCFVVLMVALLWPTVYSLLLFKRLQSEGRA
jgi:uncharacterized membrane protein